MAQTNSGKPSGPDVSDKKLRALWKQVTAQKLVALLAVKDATSRWTANGRVVTGCCPFHADTQSSFRIFLARGYGKCSVCAVFAWDPITFWSKVTGLGRGEAFIELKQHFTFGSVAGMSGPKLLACERSQRLKKEIMRIAHGEMLNAVNEPQNPDYAAMQPAVNYLLNVRKIPVEALPSLNCVGILPPILRIVAILQSETDFRNELEKARAAEEHSRANLEASLAPDAAKYLESVFGWTGSLVFSMDRTPDTISRLKLRKPDTKEFLELSDAFEAAPGFFGLSWSLYRAQLGEAPSSLTAYVVDGEFEALSVMARQVQQGSPGFVVLSAESGVTLDDLYDLGFDRVNLTPRAPHKRGGETVQRWLTTVDRLEAQVFCGYALWPGAGDVDDAAVTQGLPAVQAVLLAADDDSVFKTPPRWLLTTITDAILATPVEQSRHRVELASGAGKTLRNKNDREDFVVQCHALFGIPPGMLKRDMSTHTDTEEGFVLRTAEELQREFFVIGVRRDGTKQVIRLWHRETKRVVSVTIGDVNDMVQTLGPYIGAVWHYFEEQVGIPDHVNMRIAAQKGGSPLMKKDAVLSFYLKQAIIMLSLSANDCGTAKTLGQGIHRIDKNGGCEIYMVNGADVYHGFFVAEDDLRWKRLEGPADAGYIFSTEGSKWAKSIASVADLQRATTVNPSILADKLLKILSVGWQFKNHTSTVKFLAYHLMAATVSAAFDRKVIVGLHADTSAGKSKLLLGLIAGIQDEEIHLIEATEGFKAYSAAGFKQELNNKSLAACIDEFEDDASNPQAAAAVANIQTTVFRGIQSGNNTQKMGTRGGQATGYSLNFFVFLAAIHRARDPQNANRLIQVSMEKVEGRESPNNAILALFPAEELAQLRADLTIALLPHMQTLRDNFRELDRVLTPSVGGNVTIEDRLRNGLLPGLSVMKLLGRDYKEFLLEYCTDHADLLVATGTRTDSKDIFDWITQTAQIPVEGVSGRSFTSFLALLGTPESRASVNCSGTGLFFDENTRMLVVNWTMATQSVLKNHQRFGRSTSSQNLRELANRVPFAATTEELEASGALLRLRSYGLYGVPAHQLTAYRLNHLLDPQEPRVAGQKDSETKDNVIALPKKNDPTFG